MLSRDKRERASQAARTYMYTHTRASSIKRARTPRGQNERIAVEEEEKKERASEGRKKNKSCSRSRLLLLLLAIRKKKTKKSAPREPGRLGSFQGASRLQTSLSRIPTRVNAAVGISFSPVRLLQPLSLSCSLLHTRLERERERLGSSLFPLSLSLSLATYTLMQQQQQRQRQKKNEKTDYYCCYFSLFSAKPFGLRAPNRERAPGPRTRREEREKIRESRQLGAAAAAALRP